MKITMYELLGLVKDGKAPKKIRYNNDVYVYVEKYGDYRCEKTLLYLTDKIIRDNDYNRGLALNNEVEILEEEKKIPEKLSTKTPFDDKEKEVSILENRVKINEIIDYLESKGDE